jgi:hypothetical protein
VKIDLNQPTKKLEIIMNDIIGSVDEMVVVWSNVIYVIVVIHGITRKKYVKRTNVLDQNSIMQDLLNEVMKI